MLDNNLKAQLQAYLSACSVRWSWWLRWMTARVRAS